MKNYQPILYVYIDSQKASVTFFIKLIETCIYQQGAINYVVSYI
jgi:hypothetical protein